MHCLLLNYSPGQFGKVYKANLKVGTEVKVAIKTIRRYTSEKETQDFMREMSTMANMMHPNIIRLYGLVSEGESLSSDLYQFTRLVNCHALACTLDLISN